jgi:hypothetical protein
MINHPHLTFITSDIAAGDKRETINMIDLQMGIERDASLTTLISSL